MINRQELRLETAPVHVASADPTAAPPAATPILLPDVAVVVPLDRRLVAVALFTVAMPAVMLAVGRGLIPEFSLDAPVWWLLPPLAVGYWVAWVWWAERE